MVDVVFIEEFDGFIRSKGNLAVVPEGSVKRHVVNAKDLRRELGKKTILKDYDPARVDLVQVLGTTNSFSGLGNVIVVESQGYRLVIPGDSRLL